jgi:hypothetical protein
MPICTYFRQFEAFLHLSTFWNALCQRSNHDAITHKCTESELNTHQLSGYITGISTYHYSPFRYQLKLRYQFKAILKHH